MLMSLSGEIFYTVNHIMDVIFMKTLYIVQFEKERVLKVATIFGANAADKSNLFLAIIAAILIIRRSNYRKMRWYR